MNEPIAEMTLIALQKILASEDAAPKQRFCKHCGAYSEQAVKKVRLLTLAGAQSYFFWECPKHPLADMMVVKS